MKRGHFRANAALTTATLTLALLGAPSVRAAVKVDLQIDAADQAVVCTDRDALVASVQDLVRGSPDAATRDLQAVVHMERAGEADWRVRLETRLDGTTGTRTLAGGTCPALVRATTLILALMLNPRLQMDPDPDGHPEATPGPRQRSANDRGVSTHPGPAPPPPTRARQSEARQAREATAVTQRALAPQPPVPASKADAASPPDADISPRWRVRLSGGMGGGMVPAARPDFGLAVGFTPIARWRWLTLEVGARAGMPRQAQPLLDAPWGRTSFSDQALEVALCSTTARSRLAIGVCGTGGVQWLRARSTGYASSQTSWQPLGTFGGRLQAHWPVRGAWAVTVETALGARTTRMAYEVPPYGLAWRTPTVMWRVGLGVAWTYH